MKRVTRILMVMGVDAILLAGSDCTNENIVWPREISNDINRKGTCLETVKASLDDETLVASVLSGVQECCKAIPQL